MIDTIATIPAALALLLILFVPGWALYRLIGLNHQLLRARLTLQLALGFCVMLFVGLGLSFVGIINAASLYVVYGAITAASAGLLVRKSGGLKGLLSLPFRFPKPRLGHALIAIPFLVGILAWFSYIGAHTADAGWHTFWARWIITTGRLPDYSIVGSSVPSSLFVFGPHFFLASISLTSQVSVADVFWIPLLLLYLLILLAVQSITVSLTKSEVAGAFASLLYVLSQIPAARILLGNLPDIMGYFLVAALVLSLIQRIDLRSSLVPALLAPATIAYYQYALLTEALLLVLLGILMVLAFALRPSRRLSDLRPYRWVWLPTILATGIGLLLASQVSYLNPASVQLIQGTRWPAPTFAAYEGSLGNPYLLWSGLAGLVVLWTSGKANHLLRERAPAVMTSWILALVVASNGPRLGFGVEPIRFIWHLVEPFAITSGVLVAFVLRATSNQLANSTTIGGATLKIAYSSERNRRLAKTGIVVILGVFLLVLPFQSSWPGWQGFPEPFYQDDIAIGQWLATHAKPDSGIAVSSDVDPSATWIQVQALRPRFYYRADYAVGIAAPASANVYRDMATLFDSPFSIDAVEVINKYNISYVVAHSSGVQDFSYSLFFAESYRFGEAAVFEPTNPRNYGYTESLNGYLVSTSSGERATLLSYARIVFRLTNKSTVTIPVHGQLLTPPTGVSTMFSVAVDGFATANYTIGNNVSVDTNLGLPKLFPSIQYSNVSEPTLVNLTLDPGDHVVEIASRSGLDFEIYLGEFAQSSIAVNTTQLTIVNPE